MDAKCCLSNWFATEQGKFMSGDLNRWPELQPTIDEALKARNARLLNKLFHANQQLLMARSFQQYPPPLICCDAGAPFTVLGWCLGRPEVLGFVYVKAKFRHVGMGSAMVDAVCN
jgi:hypothetical protein